MLLLIARLLQQGRRFLWKCMAESPVITWTTSDISNRWSMLQHQLRHYNLSDSLKQKEQPSFTAYVSTSKLWYGRVQVSAGMIRVAGVEKWRMVPWLLWWLIPVPEELLKFVRCKCKVASTSLCSTKLCSCLKHGFTCVTACSDCRETECSNVSEATPDEEEWEEDANLFERLFWVASQDMHYPFAFLLEK